MYIDDFEKRIVRSQKFNLMGFLSFSFAGYTIRTRIRIITSVSLPLQLIPRTPSCPHPYHSPTYPLLPHHDLLTSWNALLSSLIISTSFIVVAFSSWHWSGNWNWKLSNTWQFIFKTRAENTWTSSQITVLSSNGLFDIAFFLDLMLIRYYKLRTPSWRLNFSFPQESGYLEIGLKWSQLYYLDILKV